MAQNLLVRGMNNMLLDAREDRLINEILTEGLFEPGDEFRVQQQGSPNMTVRVGSGNVGDRYVVEGPGGTYLVRNPDPWIGSGNGDLPIANGDPTFDRIDGIDLVVYDDSIDSSGKTVAEIVVTQGTPASVPSAPALPTGVAAVARLATVLVEAGESTAITTGDITDLRVVTRLAVAPAAVAARVRRVANQSINHSAETVIAFDTEDEDSAGMHSSGTFTIPPGGDGFWSCYVRWVVGAGANYTVVTAGGDSHVQAAGNPLVAWAHIIKWLEGGDTVQFRAAQDSGGAQNLTAKAHVARLAI